MRSFPFHAGVRAEHPGIIDRGNVLVLRVSLGQGHHRIEVVTAKAACLRNQVLRIVAEPEFRGCSRLEPARKVAIVVKVLPVAAVGGVSEHVPVRGILLGQVLLEIDGGRGPCVMVHRIGNRT